MSDGEDLATQKAELDVRHAAIKEKAKKNGQGLRNDETGSKDSSSELTDGLPADADVMILNTSANGRVAGFDFRAALWTDDGGKPRAAVTRKGERYEFAVARVGLTPPAELTWPDEVRDMTRAVRREAEAAKKQAEIEKAEAEAERIVNAMEDADAQLNAAEPVVQQKARDLIKDKHGDDEALVEQQLTRLRTTAEARRRLAEEDAARLEADARLPEDWQPMTVEQAADRFASVVGQEWIEDLLPKAAKGNVYGPSGSAKTCGLHYMALVGVNADRGAQAFGRAPTERFGTVIVALEDEQNQHARLDAAARRHGWRTDGVMIVAPDDLPHVDDVESLARLATAIESAGSTLREQGLPLGLVAIDTAKYLTAGKDTNSVEHVSRLTVLLRSLTKRVGNAYVAVTTHTPLSGDDRPAGSHDQTASRDHELLFKPVLDGRLVEIHLKKHKFAARDRMLGQFHLESGATSYSPHTMPVLVEDGALSAALAVHEVASVKTMKTRAAEVERLLDFMVDHADGDGWVDQARLYEARAKGGFGRAAADRARAAMSDVDGLLEIDPTTARHGVPKRWRVRPGVGKDDAIRLVRGAVDGA